MASSLSQFLFGVSIRFAARLRFYNSFIWKTWQVNPLSIFDRSQEYRTITYSALATPTQIKIDIQKETSLGVLNIKVSAAIPHTKDLVNKDNPTRTPRYASPQCFSPRRPTNPWHRHRPVDGPGGSLGPKTNSKRGDPKICNWTSKSVNYGLLLTRELACQWDRSHSLGTPLATHVLYCCFFLVSSNIIQCAINPKSEVLQLTSLFWILGQQVSDFLFIRALSEMVTILCSWHVGSFLKTCLILWARLSCQEPKLPRCKSPDRSLEPGTCKGRQPKVSVRLSEALKACNAVLQCSGKPKLYHLALLTQFFTSCIIPAAAVALGNRTLARWDVKIAQNERSVPSNGIATSNHVP